ncbi:MAG: beta-propeller fold lactonase family protein [Opitutaceae bacterium]
MLSHVLPRAAVLAAALFTIVSLASAESPVGLVMTSSNATDGNRVLVFDRAADGTLTHSDSFPTGGFGTGGGLGNQSALALTPDGDWLLTVNAGSSEVSLFEVAENLLILRDIVPSGGTMPVSVALQDDLVYVLNAGGDGAPGNITGFNLAPASGVHRFPGILLFPLHRWTNLITRFDVSYANLVSAPLTRNERGRSATKSDSSATGCE